VANGVVYFGSGDDKLRAVDIYGGLLWNSTTGGAVSSSPAVANGMVYVGSDDGSVYAYAVTPASSVASSTRRAISSRPSEHALR
jgi:outer membrane protein assembly factor BamB